MENVSKVKDLYFPVEKVLVDQIMPGYEHPSGISHAVIITKPDGTKRVVNYCSEIYHLVPNEHVVGPFIDAMSKYYQVDVNYGMTDFSKFRVDIIIKGNGILVGKGDDIFPRIRMINSYDGSIQYNFSAGFYRLVCKNGMTLPVGKERVFKGMHTPKLGNETNFEAVLAMASEMIASAQDLSEDFFELKSQKVINPILRIEEVLEETPFPKTLEESVKERFGKEMTMLGETTANDWLVYNAFNYQLNHNHDIRVKETRRTDIDQAVLTYLLKY